MQDIFVSNKIYPDPKIIFQTEVKNIGDIKDTCLYILDTNALLIPYKTTSHSLREIEKIYSTLIKNNQLLIPGQVSREFASNRPEHIKQLFQQINRLKDNIKQTKTSDYPILEALTEYKKIQDYDKSIAELRSQYFQDLDKLLDIIKSWKWNDPVSKVYSELFIPDIIYELIIDNEKIEKDLDYRYENEIPPGYKDSAKTDKGIGDLIIWYTILEIGRKFKKDVVFISGDEKTDWYHRSEGQSLYPRFELVSEFFRESGGFSFSMMKLSNFMEVFGADKTSIKEIRVTEIIPKHQLKMLRTAFFLTGQVAIQNYIQEFGGNPIFQNKNNFPDFEFNDNGFICGVEIFNIGSYKDILEEIIKRKYEQADSYMRENPVDAFQIYLLTKNRDEMNSYLERINSAIKDLSMNSNITITKGYINEANSFVRID